MMCDSGCLHGENPGAFSSARPILKALYSLAKSAKDLLLLLVIIISIVFISSVRCIYRYAHTCVLDLSIGVVLFDKC